MRWIESGAVLAAALACLPAAAAAQPHAALRVGQTVESSLGAEDPALTERGRFKVYRFDARQGQRLLATMRSSEFDAYLTVARVVAGITDPMAEDDDRGRGENGTDARVRFTAPATGSYLLVAQSLAADGMGPFTVALEEAPEPTTAQSREVRVGQTVTGSLAETDAILDEDDTFYDTYVVSGQAGQRLIIEMKSDSFDAFLAFGRMENGELNVSSNDDDGGDGTNSRMRVTLAEGGEYVIRANSLGAGGVGPYTLSVVEAGPPPPPQPIAIGGPEVTGTLDENDPTLEDDSYFDYWTFTGQAGERLRIVMAADEFDTFVAIGQLEGETFTEIANNDDGGDDGTNSLIEVTLPANGTYVIRANSFSGGSTGTYRLKIERQP